MLSLGLLIVGVVYEIKNLISFILGNIKYVSYYF